MYYKARFFLQVVNLATFIICVIFHNTLDSRNRRNCGSLIIKPSDEYYKSFANDKDLMLNVETMVKSQNIRDF